MSIITNGQKEQTNKAYDGRTSSRVFCPLIYRDYTENYEQQRPTVVTNTLSAVAVVIVVVRFVDRLLYCSLSVVTCKVHLPNLSCSPVALGGLLIVVDAVDPNLVLRASQGTQDGSARPGGIGLWHVHLARRQQQPGGGR